MCKITIPVLVILFLFSCSEKKAPDVSHIKVDLEIQRFEKDLFAMDTMQVEASLNKLQQKYPEFLQDFIYNILGITPQPEGAISAVEQGVLSFIRTYRPVKDSADAVFADMSKVQDDVKQGLQYVKHYFPAYQIPNRLITFIGPFDSYGNILTTSGIAVGLQQYMGKDYSVYHTEMGQQLFPSYISRRFEPKYIPVSSMRNIIDDMYPDNSMGRPLIEQMVEAGKRLYLLDQLLPHLHDTLKTGYTEQQLEDSYDNEGVIWSMFVNNDLLYNSDPSVTKDYMEDAPKTSVLGDAAPGNLGTFTGWQIVKKWMDKNENVTLDELMKTNPKTIFEQAKYKPK